MISSPTISITCDQTTDAGPCRRSAVMTLPSFGVDRTSAGILFLKMNPEWRISKELRVSCPQCKILAERKELLARAASRGPVVV